MALELSLFRKDSLEKEMDGKVDADVLYVPYEDDSEIFPPETTLVIPILSRFLKIIIAKRQKIPTRFEVILLRGLDLLPLDVL